MEWRCDQNHSFVLSRDVPAPPLAGDTPVELAEAEGATVRSRYIQQRDRAVVVLDHPLMP